MACEILGRITEAREDAWLDEVPGDVCSVRMVVPCAMQALSEVSNRRLESVGSCHTIAVASAHWNLRPL